MTRAFAATKKAAAELKAQLMGPCMAAPPKELDERLDTFHVSASTLGGTTVEITDINVATSVEELLDKVESALCISRGMCKIVTAAGDLLSRHHACTSLADAGIVSGSALNVAVRGARLYKCAGRRFQKCPCARCAVPARPFHLLLYGDGACRLAFLRTEVVDHAGGPDHYETHLHCKNMLVGTYVLHGDVAVCTWTNHFEFVPECSDTFCVHRHPDDFGAKLVGPKEANASAEYQLINLTEAMEATDKTVSECVMCDAIDPILFEVDLPTSALGLGLFRTDEIDALESTAFGAEPEKQVEAAPPTKPGAIEVGSTVEFTGLKRRADLNGRRARTTKTLDASR
jgi:hypothetical protein